MSVKAKTLAVRDETGEIWERMVDKMLAESRHILVLHGAGSFNGISITDADRIVFEDLVPRINAYRRDGRVSVIYDGDNDDPKYPDIGHIMGRLRDSFLDWVDWYAVQMWGWYKYRNLDVPAGIAPELKALHSANGNEYQTVIFPDKTFEGDHDHFSQHPRLCRACGYEQWYVGACGLIASKQLADYSAKVAATPGVHKAVIFRVPVSIEQEQKIRRKLAEETDPAKVQRLTESLERRTANPYGLLCAPTGEFISKSEYSNLTIEVV